MSRNSPRCSSYPLVVVILLLLLTTLKVYASPPFQKALAYRSGGFFPSSIAVADLNHDGNPDVIIANLSDGIQGVVGVLLGNGDGTFRTAQGYRSGGEDAMSIAVADVNGDGNPDVLVAHRCISNSNCDNGAVGVLLGNGDGTLQGAVPYSSGGFTALAIALADVNGDGKPDVLVSNNCIGLNNCDSGSVGVLLGNGDGTFRAAQSYSSGFSAYSMAVADVNGDGRSDVVVAQCSSKNDCTGSVGVLLGNGDGTFQVEQSYATPGTYGRPYSIAIADVNRDKKLDLVVAGGCSGPYCAGTPSTVGVLLGNGDGTFQQMRSFNSGSGTVSVVIADANADGKPDLLLANWCPIRSLSCPAGRAGMLLGNGDGTFQPVKTFGSGGRFAIAIAVADVNGDTGLDLLVLNQNVSRKEHWDGSVGVLLKTPGQPHQR